MATAIFALTGLAAPAQADHTSYFDPYRLAYTNCAWYQDSGNITLSVDPARQFAANSTATDNGAVQSFQDRIIGAAGSWNSAMDTARYSRFIAVGNPAATSKIVLANQDPTAGDYLGYTYVRRTIDSSTSTNFSGRCPHETNPDFQFGNVRIEMAVEDVWWTQGNSYRSQWEKCGTSQAPNWPYSCGKQFDFEAVLAHELGHALGLMHPTQIDATAASNASGYAYCSDQYNRATVCAVTRSGYTWRSEQRVLDPYDRNSIHYHYSQKG